MKYFIQLDSNRYLISVFSTNSRIVSPDAIELDKSVWDILPRDTVDKNLNPQWVYNEDGSVTKQAITPSSVTVARQIIPDAQMTLNGIMIDIVHCLLNNKPVPKPLLTKWNTTYQNLQSAYGLIPGVTK